MAEPPKDHTTGASPFLEALTQARSAIGALYELGDQDVVLGIVSPATQLTSSIVHLDDREMGSGEIETLLIGPGPSLEGKWLRITSSANRLSEGGPTKVSVQYVLSGGKKERTFDLSRDVGEKGRTHIFVAAIQFVP